MLIIFMLFLLLVSIIPFLYVYDTYIKPDYKIRIYEHSYSYSPIVNSIVILLKNKGALEAKDKDNFFMTYEDKGFQIFGTFEKKSGCLLKTIVNVRLACEWSPVYIAEKQGTITTPTLMVEGGWRYSLFELSKKSRFFYFK